MAFEVPSTQKFEESGYLTKTANGAGWQINALDEYGVAFVEYARTTKRPIADLGVAFGFTSPLFIGGRGSCDCQWSLRGNATRTGKVGHGDGAEKAVDADAGRCPRVEFSGEFTGWNLGEPVRLLTWVCFIKKGINFEISHRLIDWLFDR